MKICRNCDCDLHKDDKGLLKCEGCNNPEETCKCERKDCESCE